jgi:tripartite-type tricarboxylate transporter receptor subunit TctC
MTLLRAFFCLLFLPAAALAQPFPSKPVRMVVPFAAGGPTDVMTRTLATQFAAQLNQQVLVENRPGAGGNIAAVHVATSPADGYTLLVAGQGILAINKALYGKIGYEPEKDFAWIGMLGSLPNVLVVHPDLPAQNMQQFIELARAQPEKISYGSNGIGSLSHLTTEVLASAAGVKFLHVPYQGAAPQRTDLLSGRIGFSFIAASTMLPLIREGKLRALAVSTNTRLASLPNVPTLVESGYPMLDAPTWFAAVAPSATPAPVLATLRAAFAAAIAAPAYGPEMEKQSSIVVKMSPEAAETMLARERKTWSDAVRSTGAKAE